ncbi:MAG: fumarylacetoacetate hydrolase family protein [Bryobacterales bacterium]|nr:fumarylacetoacetate hydrolase family protein [Bryobacterales bacterium]
MKLLNFQAVEGPAQAGVLRADRVHSLGSFGFHDVKSLLEAGEDGLARVRELLAAAQEGSGIAVADVRILAPLANAQKLIFIGLNYRDHAAEAKMDIPATPTVFAKFANAVIHPGDPIVLPSASQKPDYEAEFAFVIGKRGKHIQAANWRDYVAGYTIINDVSARDFQMATSQWIMGKTCDSFCPMGPFLTTIDEIPNPHNLRIECLLNGESMQDSNTGELIFKIPELIQHLSQTMTLEPGDVVSTGTPAGVGFSKKPPRWLRPGDDCVVRIEGLGELRNPVVAEG